MSLRHKPGGETDYGHRNLVNLLGAIALLVYGLALAWTIVTISDYLKQERCLSSGRIACRTFVSPPRSPALLP